MSSGGRPPNHKPPKDRIPCRINILDTLYLLPPHARIANSRAKENLPVSTESQIQANRENAQLSTGPKTEAGKAAAALNNTRHGLTGAFRILPTESSPISMRFSPPSAKSTTPKPSRKPCLSKPWRSITGFAIAP